MKDILKSDKETSRDETTVPVIKEKLLIDTVLTETGTIAVTRSRSTNTVDIPLPTVATTYEEKRVRHNVLVDERPLARQEGQTTIVPVFREEAVVVTRFFLVEEIHLIKRVEKTERTVSVELSEDSVTIQRK